MMKQLTIFTLLFFTTSMTVIGQSLEDAVRYSLLYNESTARSIGTGSSIGPLGVDFGAYGSNPAGLGRLRYSEAVISLGANFSLVDAAYQNGNLSESQTNIKPTLNNLGLGFANPGRGTKWKTRNFAIGITRLADFNREINLTDKTPGSITDRFLDLANGSFPQDLDPFEAGLAFDVIAIDTVPGAPTTYFSDLASVGNVRKAINHKTSGSLNELQLSFGGNYDDKLLVGLGIGISFLDYKSERTHRENDDTGSIDFFEDLTFTDALTSVGAGINIKAGIIYMPTRTIFVSIAGQSPTWYLLTDTYETSLEYAFDGMMNNSVFFDEIEPNDFEYSFTSPWRANAGVGFIIGNKGFLGAEVEYLDYTNNKFDLTRNNDNSTNSAGTDQINDDIDAILTNTLNFRVGGEVSLNEWRVRAGVGISGTPFKESSEGTQSVSFGIGYRVNKLFVDFGLRGTFREEIYFPYFTFQPPQPQIDNSNLDIAAVLSIGTKF